MPNEEKKISKGIKINIPLKRIATSLNGALRACLRSVTGNRSENSPGDATRPAVICGGCAVGRKLDLTRVVLLPSRYIKARERQES